MWSSLWYFLVLSLLASGVELDIKKDITFLEFVPIVLGFYLWSVNLQNKKKLLLHVDNLALVEIVNQNTSKNKRVMVLMIELV